MIDPLVITASHTDASCSGSDGVITLSVSGGTGETILMDQNTNITYHVGNTNVAAGTYNLIVTDANQCVSDVTMVTVTAPGNFHAFILICLFLCTVCLLFSM